MSPNQTSRTPRLRVLTYNVLHFRRWREMGELIERIDADIICLQEAIVSVVNHEGYNQVALLADRLGFHLVCNPNWRRQFCVIGHSILTRRKPTQTEILTDFEGYPFATTATFDDDGGPFNLVGVHLQWVHRPLPIGVFTSFFRRSAQIRQILNWTRHGKHPCLLAGDFNALPYSPEYKILTRKMTDCTRAVPVDHHCTRPTFGMPLQIDYVFASRHFRTLACRIHDVDYSDHRPVVVDLERVRKSDR